MLLLFVNYECPFFVFVLVVVKRKAINVELYKRIKVEDR